MAERLYQDSLLPRERFSFVSGKVNFASGKGRIGQITKSTNI